MQFTALHVSSPGLSWHLHANDANAAASREREDALRGRFVATYKTHIFH